MKRYAPLIASAAFIAAWCGRTANAQELPSPMSRAELDEARGGFLLPTGIEANFGAIARTFSDGALILETHFTWTENGIQNQQATLSPTLQPSAALAGGFQLEDQDGSTVFAHQINDNALRNILLNSAADRDIRVDTQLTVTLPGFSAVQDRFRDALLSVQLSDSLLALSNN